MSNRKEYISYQKVKNTYSWVPCIIIYRHGKQRKENPWNTSIQVTETRKPKNRKATQKIEIEIQPITLNHFKKFHIEVVLSVLQNRRS